MPHQPINWNRKEGAREKGGGGGGGRGRAGHGVRGNGGADCHASAGSMRVEREAGERGRRMKKVK